MPKNPFGSCSNSSIKYHALVLAHQALTELADSLGRFNRHMERCEVEALCDDVVDKAAKIGVEEN